MVLQAADIPSVLVEMGFMSNQKDEAALRRPEHRATRGGGDAARRRDVSFLKPTADAHPGYSIRDTRRCAL